LTDPRLAEALAAAPPGAGAVLAIDLGSVVANWRLLCSRHPSGSVAGVLKADGYGLGASRIAAALAAAGCRHFFAARLAETAALRPLLPPDAMLSALDGLLPGTEREVLELGLTPVLNDPGELTRWRSLARSEGRRLPANLHLDTGMRRLGCTEAELDALASDPAAFDGLDRRFLLTHFVSSDRPADPINDRQIATFHRLRALLPPMRSSLANSSGIFLGPRAASDLARPGAALYGINPTPGVPNPMQPVVSLHARILSVRDCAPGDTVGYNATWTAARPSRIATIALGYADGYLRALSGKAAGLLHETPVPLVGRVSMDLLTFDVTEVPQARAGDWLTVLGGPIDADALAALAGTNGYEILTSLGPRYERVWIDPA